MEIFVGKLLDMILEAIYHDVQRVEEEAPPLYEGHPRTSAEWLFERADVNRANLCLAFLNASFNRMVGMEKNPFLSGSEKDILATLGGVFKDCTLNFLTGDLLPDSDAIVAASLGHAFVEGHLSVDFIEYLYSMPAIFEHFFDELRNHFFDELRNVSVNLRLYRSDPSLFFTVLRMLHEVIGHKIKDERVFAKIFTSRPDFCPDLKTDAPGRELQQICFFGPFLSIGPGTVDISYGNIPFWNKYFDGNGDLKANDRFISYKGFQEQVRSIRDYLKTVFHTLLINAPTRGDVLRFFALAVNVNQKRAQMHSDYRKHGYHSFMVNLLDILYQHSEKIALDKVNGNYIFNPECRIEMTDETRFKCTQEEVQNYASGLTPEQLGDVRFTTECFFLTMHAQKLAINPALDHMKKLRRYLKDAHQSLNQLKAKLQGQSGAYIRKKTELMLKQISTQIKHYVAAIMSIEAIIYDEFLIVHAIQFADKQLQLVVNTINPNYPYDCTLPNEAPFMFRALPEFYLQNLVSFYNFILRSKPGLLITHCPEVAERVLIFICCTHYFNNPFLAADIVDLLVNMCPMFTPQAEPLFRRLLAAPLAQERLFSSLVKFYSDVESTGASSEFYDKFNIRRSIQIIFQHLWEDIIYRERMKEMAGEAGPEFVRFINMVINDTTFLLDESLSGLRKVHEIETIMKNEVAWNGLSQEERELKEGILQEASRSVRSWLILGNETMEMFLYLTEGAPDVFKNPALGERLASMLNHNISQLCGDKCSNLKVNDPERFHWNPRKLLEQVSQIYLHLFSTEFVNFVAADERSYTPEMFQGVLSILESKSILTPTELEVMSDLAAQFKECYDQKVQREEDFGDDIPEEFKDPVMDTLMTNPVVLPSGHRMDLKHIQRHLLSSRTDPFTRGAMTEEDLVPDVELKKKIDEWKATKLNKITK
uniref:RING-type E3 ubiquitin transferase n=2 Tax=Steinernema glaseri TaxID=37863 RepID=A0A1I8A6L0_9BILA